MTSVWVITSGCVHDGGGVDAVFLSEALAVAKFDAMCQKVRDDFVRNKQWTQEYYTKEKYEEYLRDSSESFSTFEHWREFYCEFTNELEEELTVGESGRTMIVKRMDYISLKRWDNVE